MLRLVDSLAARYPYLLTLGAWLLAMIATLIVGSLAGCGNIPALAPATQRVSQKIAEAGADGVITAEELKAILDSEKGIAPESIGAIVASLVAAFMASRSAKGSAQKALSQAVDAAVVTARNHIDEYKDAQEVIRASKEPAP